MEFLLWGNLELNIGNRRQRGLCFETFGFDICTNLLAIWGGTWLLLALANKRGHLLRHGSLFYDRQNEKIHHPTKKGVNRTDTNVWTSNHCSDSTETWSSLTGQFCSNLVNAHLEVSFENINKYSYNSGSFDLWGVQCGWWECKGTDCITGGGGKQ